MIFNLALESIVRVYCKVRGEVHVGMMHKYLAHADDVTVLGSNPKDIRRFGRYRLTSETKYMIISRNLHLEEEISVANQIF